MANTKYYILEREVDKKTFDKYKDQTFEIGGHKKNLLGLKIWATSKDVAEACPEEAAEAKVIYDRILSEISKAAPKKKQTFHGFLEELNGVYKEESGKYFKALEAFEIARKEFDATMADSKAPDYIKMIAKGEFERAKETVKQAKREAGDSYKARAAEIRDKMQEFATEFYRATPDRIDQSAMQLLNTGIMSADEMEHLAEQFRGNPPMLRVIGQYALNKFDSMSDRDEGRWAYRVIGKKLQKAASSDSALDGFDGLMEFGQNGLGTDEIMANVRAKHWDRIYNSARESYDNYIVQTGSSEE